MNFESDFALLIYGRLTEAADSIEAVNPAAVLRTHLWSAEITWIKS